MAICRFSNYQCDLYIFEAQEGIVVMVAAVRYEDEPPPPEWRDIGETPGQSGVAFWRAQTDYRARLEACRRVPIGLPHDGDYRRLGTWGEVQDYVTGLKALGYNVPDWVIDEIAGEIDDATAAKRDDEDERLPHSAFVQHKEAIVAEIVHVPPRFSWQRDEEV